MLVSNTTLQFFRGEAKDIFPQLSLHVINRDQEDFVNLMFDQIAHQFELGFSSVDKLCGQMGISRPQLYRKVRALTGYSPKKFIRETRLCAAYSLIRSSEKSVSDIAYQLGFGQPSIFSKQFKQRFGETPSKAIKKFAASQKPELISQQLGN